MGATPEELKAEIDRTREELTADVDALAEKVSPTAIAQSKPVKAGLVVFGAGVLTGTLVRSRIGKRREHAKSR
jgi:hypothetical protein